MKAPHDAPPNSMTNQLPEAPKFVKLKQKGHFLPKCPTNHKHGMIPNNPYILHK